ncbi:MAG: hypothetical protein YK1312THETA_940007, partial [Marine Group I thaumarchaeote]
MIRPEEFPYADMGGSEVLYYVNDSLSGSKL